jgi:APA family basic amino acid/polyamine antiporter
MTPRGESSMRRDLGPLLAGALVVNGTIGTGIFKTPAEVARLSGSLTAALAVWVIGAVIALAGALTLAELSASMPRTGGLYEVLRRAYGERVAFVYGWAKLTLLVPASVGSFAKLAAESTVALLGLPALAWRDTAVTLGYLVLFAAANVIGVRRSAVQQAAVTVAKYLGVAFLAFIGLALVPHGAVPLPSPAPAFATVPTVSGCAAALVAAMWAYDGWADLTSLSGEIRDPGRTLPRALIVGTLGVAVVYLATNLGYARALGLEGLRRSTSGDHMAATNVATLTLGSPGRHLLAGIIVVCSVGGGMTSLLTSSRVFVPLGTDGLFLRALGVVSPRTFVPVRAVVTGTVLAGLFVTVRSFEQLTEGFVVGYFPFYVLAMIAVPILRRREPDLPRPYRIPLYPVPPLLFLVGAAVLFWGALSAADRTAWIAFGVLFLGVPVGWAWRRWAR